MHVAPWTDDVRARARDIQERAGPGGCHCGTLSMQVVVICLTFLAMRLEGEVELGVRDSGGPCQPKLHVSAFVSVNLAEVLSHDHRKALSLGPNH